MPRPPDPATLLPLSEPVFAILLALADAPRHGYGIILAIERRSALRIGTGTLYTAIHRLLADGLIEETSPPPDADSDDERRRYYRLTAFGRRVAAAEAHRLERLVAIAREQKLLPRLAPAGGQRSR